MVERSSAIITPAKTPDHDIAVEPFEKFQQSIQAPQICGVVSEVIRILDQRVGVGPLDIEQVAKELNLSKRTLQRHLHKRGNSFVELRDKVRFRHAMVCLLEKHMSIESTASYLHFSDRTSFTNSFKRWSGYSPNTFRKIYRGNSV